MAKILVIDDDQQQLTVVRMTLETGGHDVVATQDPAQGLLHTEDPRIDAVILDIVMPISSGWDVLQKIRNNPITEQLPVLMLSQLSEVDDRVRGIRYGADDYMIKPFHPDELLARVEALISRKATHLSGHQGRIESQSIPDLVQSFEQSGKSGILEIATETSMGRLVIRHGRFYAADFLGLTGDEAFMALAEIESGLFRFFPSRIQSDDLDETGSLRSFQIMLMDSVWVADELRERELPAPAKRLRMTGALPEIPEDFQALPLTEVAAHFRGPAGASLGGALARNMAAPNRVRLAVAWLFEQGLLQTV